MTLLGNREAATGAGFGLGGGVGFMYEVGKIFMVVGVALVMVGVALTVFGRVNLPFGRLPGDIIYRGKNTTFYFPLATSILVSVVLSIVLYVVGRWKR
jgi:hypothetical protein